MYTKQKILYALTVFMFHASANAQKLELNVHFDSQKLYNCQNKYAIKGYLQDPLSGNNQSQNIQLKYDIQSKVKTGVLINNTFFPYKQQVLSFTTDSITQHSRADSFVVAGVCRSDFPFPNLDYYSFNDTTQMEKGRIFDLLIKSLSELEIHPHDLHLNDTFSNTIQLALPMAIRTTKKMDVDVTYHVDSLVNDTMAYLSFAMVGKVNDKIEHVGNVSGFGKGDGVLVYNANNNFVSKVQRNFVYDVYYPNEKMNALSNKLHLAINSEFSSSSSSLK